MFPRRLKRPRHSFFLFGPRGTGKSTWLRQVDFIWTGPRHSVGIEVKASQTWRKGYGAPLRELHARKVIRRAIGVYEGELAQKDGPVDVLPVREFFERLPVLFR